MSTPTKTPGLLPMRGLWKDFFDTDSFFGKFMDKFWDSASPAVNISESGNAYAMEIVVPGFKKEDINVDVEKDILTVSAEAKSESSEEKKEYTRKEYNFSSFKHSYMLPDNVKDDAITAEYKDGILHLTLPKSDKQVTASKNIAVN